MSSMGKLNRTFKILLWVFAALGLLFFALIVYLAIFPANSFEFKFVSAEDNSPVDGKVYLGKVYLGETTNGKLSVDNLNLTSGILGISGIHKDKQFDLYYDFKGEWVKDGNKEYVISEEDLLIGSFNASALDLKSIESQILERVNAERAKYLAPGIRSLRFNNKLSEFARAYSKKTIEQDYSGVENEDKEDFDSRLIIADIFNLGASENHYSLSVKPDTDIAKEVVDGWLENTATRTAVIDSKNLYSDGGVGIACIKNVCYITMEFVSLRNFIQTEMNGNMCWTIPLYDESSFHNLPLNIKLKFESFMNTDVYITKESSKDDCINRRDISAAKEYLSVTKINDNLKIEKGDVILLATKGKSKMNITVDYLLA